MKIRKYVKSRLAVKHNYKMQYAQDFNVSEYSYMYFDILMNSSDNIANRELCLLHLNRFFLE